MKVNVYMRQMVRVTVGQKGTGINVKHKRKYKDQETIITKSLSPNMKAN